MTPRDFMIIMMCCLFWAGNFVAAAWALGNNPVPPFMLAAVRASMVLAMMSPYLFRKLPQNFGLLLVVCALVGPVHLGFLYTGLQTASATASSIVAQFLTPLAALLSVIILKERIGWVRSLAITGAFIGVMVMVIDLDTLAIEFGLIYLLVAYAALALASVLMKRVGPVSWQQYVAWVAVLVLITMTTGTLLFETGHAVIWTNSKWPLLIAAGYAAIFVSIIAHGQYFNIIQKYDISQVVPLTMTQPLFATALGVSLLGEEIFPRYIIGALILLPCVYVIAKRSTPKPTTHKEPS